MIPQLFDLLQEELRLLDGAADILVYSYERCKGRGGLADLFGLWAHKDITLNEIRKKAWSRRGVCPRCRHDP